MQNYYDTILHNVQTSTMLTMRGLSLSPSLLSRCGIVPIEYPEPHYNSWTHFIEADGPPVEKSDGTAYVQHFLVHPLPLADLPAKLEQLQAEKKTEFDAFFQTLDALKTRPAAAIAEMLALGLPPDAEDVAHLTIFNMVAEENRGILHNALARLIPDNILESGDLVAACAIIHVAQAVCPWVPWDGERSALSIADIPSVQ